jgi:hypothetical protein
VSTESIVAVAAAIVGVITAVTALVVQTQRLVTIAEAYMVELRRANIMTEAVHVAQLAAMPPVQMVAAPQPPQTPPSGGRPIG